MNSKRIRKMTQLTMLLAMGIILHSLEPDIPVFLAARFRIGFANIIGIIVLILYSKKEMFAINVVRVLLASLMKGTFLSLTFWASLSGVLLSTIVVIIVHQLLKSSVTILSVVGALFHTIGQMAVIAFAYQSVSILLLSPHLLIMSLAAGVGIGLIAENVLKHLKKAKLNI